MSFEQLASGSVVRYPYLWARQSAQGETEGRKERPAVVAVRLRREGGDVVFLFPITTSPPVAGQWAVEIPQSEKAGAGLDEDKQQWLILNEFNEDTVGRSYYLGPRSRIGRFGARFFLPLVQEIIARRSELTSVPRS